MPSAAPIKSGPIVYVALGDSTGLGQGARNGGYVDRMFRKLELERPGSRLVNLCVLRVLRVLCGLFLFTPYSPQRRRERGARGAQTKNLD